MKQNGYLKALVLLTVGVIACAVSWSQWIPYNQKQQMLQTIDEWRFYPATAKVIASDTIALPGSGVLLTVTGAGAVSAPGLAPPQAAATIPINPSTPDIQP